MTLMSPTQWEADRLELVAFQFGMQSTSERDWFRVSYALQAIEPHLVCRVHRPRLQNTFRQVSGLRTLNEEHIRYVAGRKIR